MKLKIDKHLLNKLLDLTQEEMASESVDMDVEECNYSITFKSDRIRITCEDNNSKYYTYFKYSEL